MKLAFALLCLAPCLGCAYVTPPHRRILAERELAQARRDDADLAGARGEEVDPHATGAEPKPALLAAIDAPVEVAMDARTSIKRVISPNYWFGDGGRSKGAGVRRGPPPTRSQEQLAAYAGMEFLLLLAMPWAF